MPVNLRATLAGVALLLSSTTTNAEGVAFPSAIGGDALTVEEEALSAEDVSYCSELQDCVVREGHLSVDFSRESWRDGRQMWEERRHSE